jgi:hypothetical protein
MCDALEIFTYVRAETREAQHHTPRIVSTPGRALDALDTGRGGRRLCQWVGRRLAQRPTNTLGLVIHCVVAGVIGLVVMTLIEMHVEPWRFVNEETQA